jgi:hypothetical protein
MLRKTILALAATAAIGVSTLPATDASAHRYGGWHRGWHHSAGTATMDGTVTMAGTAITDGTAGTTIGSDRPASGTPEQPALQRGAGATTSPRAAEL